MILVKSDYPVRRRQFGAPRTIALESGEEDREFARMVQIVDGALATRNNGMLFNAKIGSRYRHTIDPRTGAPVDQAPRSVTVSCTTCMDVGVKATLAMLHGGKCRGFFEIQSGLGLVRVLK